MKRLMRTKSNPSSGEFNKRLECFLRHPSRGLTRNPLNDASVRATFDQGAIRSADGTDAALIVMGEGSLDKDREDVLD